MEESKSSEFLNYINKPLDKENLSNLYSDNNIIYERSLIYQDFILSLIDLICETYMGYEITNEENKIKHFDCCWDKTIKNFNEENIHFTEKNGIYDYFFNFMFETFYLSKNKNDKLHFNLLK